VLFLSQEIKIVDEHMNERGHFDDLFRYIANETQDSKFANVIVNSIRSGNYDTLRTILYDENFLKNCIDLAPSEYYGGDWRKKGNIKVAIQDKTLYFELVFF
jgi:hypothetical protein